MQSLFNYTTLDTRLEKSTRTLYVTLNRPQEDNALSMEMLFEIESLLAWCTNKVEINSIFINSSAKFFSKGIEKKSLASLSGTHLEKLFIKLQKIIFSMMQLPQIIVIDLSNGCELLGSEFSLGADIRLAHSNASVAFNHTHFGFIPGAGGIGMLSTLVGHSHAKNWIHSGEKINSKVLLESGFLKSTYVSENHQATICELLKSINQIAPVQRIQSKLALFESMRAQIEAGIIIDRKISKASLITEDWRRINFESTNTSDFLPAKSMSYAVKLSLIKNQSSELSKEN